MSLFSNDMRVANTAAPSFQSQANVGQFGWTGTDQGHYNQLIQYVDECRKIWMDMEEKIAYVEQLLLTVANIDEQVKYVTVVAGEVQKWRTETLAARDQTINAKNEVLPLIDDFDIKYTDFTEKYILVVQMHSETNDAATAAAISEAAAAASAKEAADIAEELRKGQVYRGTWNIEKNAGYPPKPDTNSVWDVTLNEGSIEYKFDNTTWYWGDRLLFLKDDDKYSQIEAGGSVTSVNGKKGAVTINASDVGAVAKAGDKMTGALKFVDDNKFVSPSGDNLHLSAKSGTVVLESKNNPIATVGGTNRTIYHTGNKPTPSEIGAVTSAGFTMEGPLKVGNAPASIQNLMGTNIIRSGGAGSHATVIGNTSARTYIDSPDETLILRAAGVERRIYTQGFKPTTTEIGAVNKGGDTMDGPLRWGDSNKYVNGSDTNMFVAAKTGAVYLECKTNPMVRIGGVDSTLYHTGNKPSATEVGAIPSVGGIVTGPLKWSDDKKYITGTGNDLYVVAKSGKVILEGASSPVARVGSSDYKIYHQGDKPTPADIGALPSAGGTLGGDLVVQGGITSKHGLTITGTGNIQAMPGGFLRCNTDSVMAMDGGVYSFVTSRRDAHLCYNSFWNGADWQKYDDTGSSGYFVVKEEGLQYISSDAGSSNPNQKRATVLTTAISGFTDASNFMVAEAANGWIINNHEVVVHKFPGGAHVKGIIRRNPGVGKVSDVILRFYQNVRLPYSVYHLDKTTAAAPLGWSYSEYRNFDANDMSSGGWNDQTGWIMVDFLVMDSV